MRRTSARRRERIGRALAAQRRLLGPGTGPAARRAQRPPLPGCSLPSAWPQGRPSLCSHAHGQGRPGPAARQIRGPRARRTAAQGAHHGARDAAARSRNRAAPYTAGLQATLARAGSAGARLLVAVLQDGRQPRQQILDWRRHLRGAGLSCVTQWYEINSLCAPRCSGSAASWGVPAVALGQATGACMRLHGMQHTMTETVPWTRHTRPHASAPMRADARSPAAHRAMPAHARAPAPRSAAGPMQRAGARAGARLGHADHVDDALERAQDGPQHLRVLLAQVLVQHNAQVPQQLLLVARLRAQHSAPQRRPPARYSWRSARRHAQVPQPLCASQGRTPHGDGSRQHVCGLQCPNSP